MKKSGITLFVLFIIILAVIIGICNGKSQEKQIIDETMYFRIHIRANSNSNSDQQVKYKVKEEVASYLSTIICNSTTKEEAISIISKNKNQIEKIANRILQANSFYYLSKAEITNEYFPTRVYENVTLEAGEYDSLILNLGSGKGDNWWCVIYPPLCFSSQKGETITYKSKVYEIIKEIFN